MRFPDIFQTLLLIILLIILHWFLNEYIPLPEQDNLKALIVTITKITMLFAGILILSKRETIDKQDIRIKRPNVYLCLTSIFVSILIVFNPIFGYISFFKVEDILKIADSVVAKSVDIFVVLNLVIFTPIFEEFFFRGIIVNGLKNNYNITLALILSSVLFGVFHIGVMGSMAFALWMGWIFLKTKNILLCIIAHSTCNLISVFFRIIAKGEQGRHFFTYIGENAIVISVVMLAIAVTLFYLGSKKFEYASRALVEHNEL